MTDIDWILVLWLSALVLALICYRETDKDVKRLRKREAGRRVLNTRNL